jgi:hypothetical protein
MQVARTLWRAVLAAAAAALVVVAPAAGGAYTQGPLVLASQPSPFAGCTVGGPGTNYPNSEVEPFVAVSPANANNIIGVFQQDRWDNGGAHGIVAAVTHDGGQTWSETWPHFSTCAGGTAANGGDYDRSSDPWVTFAPNGDAYFISLSASADLPLCTHKRIGQPDRRHQVAARELGQHPGVDPVGLARQRRQSLRLLRVGDLDLPAGELEPVVHEAGAVHRLDRGADRCAVPSDALA